MRTPIHFQPLKKRETNDHGLCNVLILNNCRWPATVSQCSLNRNVAAHKAATKDHMDSTKLPEGWHTAYDARYQRWYYFNPSTGATQWNPPETPPAALVPSTSRVNGQMLHSSSDITGLQPCQEPHDALAAEAAMAATTSEHPFSSTAYANKPSSTHAAAAAAAAATHRLEEPRDQSYWYYDPKGNLLGPFSYQQLRAWRPLLPLDLVLLLNVQGNYNSSSSSSSKQAVSTHFDRQHGDQPTAVESRLDKQQREDPLTTTAAAAAAADHDDHDDIKHPVAGSSQQQENVAEVEQQADVTATETQTQLSQPTAAAEQQQSSQVQHASTNSLAPSKAANPSENAAAAAAAGDKDSSSSSSIMLADVLGDSHLLAAWKSAQQQQQQQWPPKATAPPAPIVENWYNSCYNSSSSGGSSLQPPTAAAAAAVTSQHAMWPIMHANAYQQTPKAAAAATTATASAGFNKYAAAVLQGLPPDDEAVQLANLAAAHGYTLQDVLQQQQRNAAGNAPDNASSGLLLTKDPRSGRLTAAAAAAAGSSGGAAELYGDLMRWCNPLSLEEQLARRAKKRQKV